MSKVEFMNDAYLILCKSKDKFTRDYTLKKINSLIELVLMK